MNELAEAAAIAETVVRAFRVAPATRPYPHFLLTDLLPNAVCRRLAVFDVAAVPRSDGSGRRETQNAGRLFLSPVVRVLDPDLTALARAFQDRLLVGWLACRTGAALDGSLLRIEYCADSDGFWLEPHTDIAAKRLTLLIYLNDPPAEEDWGTDLYEPDGTLAGTAPSRADAGLAFVPASDTWHGFRRRPITGTRRTLIVNYVAPDWRSVHELAFPGKPVRPSIV